MNLQPLLPDRTALLFYYAPPTCEDDANALLTVDRSSIRQQRKACGEPRGN